MMINDQNPNLNPDSDISAAQRKPRGWVRRHLTAMVAAVAIVAGVGVVGVTGAVTANAAPPSAAAAAKVAGAAGTTGKAKEAAATAASGTIVGNNSGLCLSVTGASTSAGAITDLYTCNGSVSETWTVETNGTIVGNNSGLCLSASGNSSALKTTADINTCDGDAYENWTVESNGTLVEGASGLCLSVTGSSTALKATADLYTCNGSVSENWTVSTSGTSGSTPNLGSNVYVFNTSMSTTTIQDDINAVYNTQESNQFGTQRYELMFEPGTYDVTVPVGFYTEVVGLGQNPSQTVITGGGIYTDASWNGGNATENFWRDVENITIDPSSGSTEWAASQAAPLRRVDIIGNAVLADDSGWASGGFIGDSVVTGQVNSETQQQYISRNDQFGSWTSSSWNMVFVGDTGVPGQSFPSPPDTTVGSTPTIDEKPYVYIDSSGNWDVFVPSNRTNSTGVSWANGNTPGTSLPLSDFYIATPSSTVSEINAALAGGEDLLFTPGVYQVNGTIDVTNPDTVVLGLGLATLVSNNGDTILQTSDVNGIRIGGLIFDAGTTNSNVLVQIGPSGSSASHSSDPTVLSDVFARIGGATVGKATETLQINSDNVIGDDLWLWRADHGNSGTVGWTTNTAANGLVVNGADVTMYGLAVEHYQAVQTQWNGQGGADYFYQSEMPYDPPNESSWMDGSSDGYPSINVASGVSSFKAYGLGVYCNFDVNSSVISENAITAPDVSGVQFNDMVTISLGGEGTIEHIINGDGSTVSSSNEQADLTSYN
jgi:Ricin-type beta-trefoil lectin domain